MSLVLLHENDLGIPILTLNRPEKRNALNIALLTELCQHLETIQKDPSKRVLILNGTGPIFCTGLDLEEALDGSKAEESAIILTRTLSTLLHMPCMTIAALHGAAYAGGVGLAAACDFSIASEDLQMGFPEVHRGLIPAVIGILLHRQIPFRSLRELFYLGETLDAKRAQSLGLLNDVVSPATLFDSALALAQKLLKGAPQALKETKRLLTDLSYPHWDKDLDIAISYHQKARRSPEAEEGMRAFKEKRRPVW